MKKWSEQNSSPFSEVSKPDKMYMGSKLSHFEDTVSESTVPLDREHVTLVNKLAQENAVILQQIQMKEERIEDIKAQIGMCQGKLREKSIEDKELKVLSSQVESLSEQLSALENEYAKVSKAEEDLGARLDLLKRIESQVISTRQTVLTCIGLKLLARKVETFCKNRIGIAFRAMRGKIGKGKSIFIAAIGMRTTMRSKLADSLRKLRSHGHEQHMKQIDLLDRAEWFVQQNSFKRKFFAVWHHTYLTRRSTRCYLRSKLNRVFERATVRSRKHFGKLVRNALYGDQTHQDRRYQMLVLNKLNFQRTMRTLRDFSPRPLQDLLTPRTLTLSPSSPSLLLLALTSLALNSSLKPSIPLAKRQLFTSLTATCLKIMRGCKLIHRALSKKRKHFKEQSFTRLLSLSCNRKLTASSTELQRVTHLYQQASAELNLQETQTKGVLACLVGLRRLKHRLASGFAAIKTKSETTRFHNRKQFIRAVGVLKDLHRENSTHSLESGMLRIMSVARTKCLAITQNQLKYNQQLESELLSLRSQDRNSLQPQLFKSKTEVLLSVGRRILMKTLSVGFLRIKLSAPLQGLQIVCQIMKATRVKRLVFFRLKMPKFTWPGDSKIVKLGLRIGFQKLQHLWRNSNSKQEQGVWRLAKFFEAKLSQHTYQLVQLTQLARIDALKRDLDDVRQHARTMESRVIATRKALDEREWYIKEADSKHLAKFLRRKSRLVTKAFFLGALMLTKLDVRQPRFSPEE